MSKSRLIQAQRYLNTVLRNTIHRLFIELLLYIQGSIDISPLLISYFIVRNVLFFCMNTKALGLPQGWAQLDGAVPGEDGYVPTVLVRGFIVVLGFVRLFIRKGRVVLLLMVRVKSTFNLHC